MKTKLLLVDDDTSVIAALTSALESEDFDVRHALDGQDALVVFHTHPDIELVLMDLNMPGRDGWDALRLMHTFDPKLPVVIITGQPNQLHAAREAGAAALIEKPVEIPELLTVVNEVLAGLRLQKVIGELCRV